MENQEEDGKAGDEEAFVQIVRCHGTMLTRYVRCRIANPTDAEDVLQETLVAVWLGHCRLRDRDRLAAWLLHVARNRCRDYFRAGERRELPLEEEALRDYASRSGLHQYRQASTLTDVLDALETAPGAAREAARRFYLEGMSVAEIAADTHSPPGTVKRRLFHARRAARAALGVTGPAPHPHMEKSIMTAPNTSMAQNTLMAQDTGDNQPPFPATRPEIRISELDEPPFAVDCQELRSWSIIPRVGERASFADYFLPGWELREVSTLRGLRVGKVHGVDGVEIEARVWKPGWGWQRPGTVFARLTDDRAEYLAVHLPHEEFTQVETFLDGSFAWNWGTVERAIHDTGLVRRGPDGALTLSGPAPRPRGLGIGFGVARLEIAGRAFTCLRVLEVPEDADLAASDDDCLTESYLTREGRTVLVRHFCRPRFPARAEFPVVLDESDRLVLNGVTFVHWYDTLTAVALTLPG